MMKAHGNYGKKTTFWASQLCKLAHVKVKCNTYQREEENASFSTHWIKEKLTNVEYKRKLQKLA